MLEKPHYINRTAQAELQLHMLKLRAEEHYKRLLDAAAMARSI